MDSKIKNKHDALMRHAEFNIMRFDERREYSWKVSLGFWGAILGSFAILEEKASSLSPGVIFIVTIIMAGLHLYWLANVFSPDKKDKLLAFKARDEALKLADPEIIPPKLELETRKLYCDWSFWFQFSVTALLLIIIALYLS